MSCDDLFAGCEAVQHHIRSIGYGLGTAWNWLWACLEMPRASRRVRRIGNIAALCICLPVAVVFLAKTTQWQNSIRAVMSMEPITGTLPIRSA